ncbi:hypothetical protein M422DRAFT_242708 [Sphaerobolus stellatus SS14]|nr:hypothetical protein M422DRAFT_242708 [Sphaerobolus stellatus SS14]
METVYNWDYLHVVRDSELAFKETNQEQRRCPSIQDTARTHHQEPYAFPPKSASPTHPRSRKYVFMWSKPHMVKVMLPGFVAVDDGEPTTGPTVGDLSNPPSNSVDPQQSPEVHTPEHPDEPYANAYGTAHQGSDSPRGVAGASGTATQGPYSPRGMGPGSGSWQNLGDAPSEPERVSPDPGDTEDEDEDFLIPAKEVKIIRKEYTEFVNLKENAEIVVAEAMEATERVNIVFNRIRTSMNRMSLRMKEIFMVPSKNVSGKTREPGNNRVHDRAAAIAATEQIIAQTAIIEPVPRIGTDEHKRTTRSRIPGDWYSQSSRPHNICEDIPGTAHGEQSDESQRRCSREAHTGYTRATRDERVTTQLRAHNAHDIRMTEGTRHEPRSVNTRDRVNLSADQVIQGVPESIECSRRSMRDPQSIDMNALHEEIKQTISATIKDKLRSDADSVTTVSQSIQALDANAQYWSDLSNKAARRSRRALELQLKLAEEKVNTLLYEEAPEEVLLEAAQEVQSIHFQLDQNMRLHEAGLMPEQQVRFSADTGRNAPSPSRNYGVNPIREEHTPQPEIMCLVNMTSEYSGIQQMVRQALQNASLEDEPEKSFLAKASVKMGTPPTYSGERNLEKFENWVASLLRFMSMYNLLGP